MAAIFGNRSNASLQTNYTGVQIQTSSAGVCIPLLWGCTRIGTNVIDLNDFHAPSSKGGKGGGKKQKHYTTSCILALCEGPVQQCDVVWQNANQLSTPAALNLTLFTGTIGQAPPAWMTSHHPDKADGYTETAFFFSSSYDLGSSPYLPNHNFEVFGKFASLTGSPDVNFALIIEDFITSPQYGADSGATYIDAASWEQYWTYCQAFALWGSPYLHAQEQGHSILQRWAQLTNSWLFWSGTALKFVPLGDAPGVGNGASYTPNLSAIYDLGIDDFIFDAHGGTPVQVDRIDPADGYNNIEIDIKDRVLQYATNPIRWSDQASVDQYGLLQAQIINAEEICDANIGATMAALIGKRATYIRNTYTFKLQSNFVLLEPGDIVTLTEPNEGLAKFPVRITEIEEDENGNLSFKAEELPAAIGSVTAFPSQVGQPATPPDLNVDPGNVNVPGIVEPPDTYTNGNAQLWIGASGGANWGGCDVWASADGTNYTFIGTITTPCIQGTLTAGLPDAAGLDLVNTLSIDTTECNQALPSGTTTADADADRTVSLIGAEMLSYGTVTPTGAFTTNLSYLQRGRQGTTHAAHSIGAQFTRLNPSAVLTYAVTAADVGNTFYFKFLSFNIFGGAEQALSDVSAYTYTPNGRGLPPPSSGALLPWTNRDGSPIHSPSGQIIGVRV